MTYNKGNILDVEPFVTTVMSKSKSPLRYPGGKTRACAALEAIMVEHFGVPSTMYSPFFGGGSFELHMRDKYGCRIVAADGFAPLANFWKVIENTRTTELVERVRQLKPLSKERFKELRLQVNDNTIDDVTRAAYYYALNRCSFSGATMSGGFSNDSEATRFNDSAIQRLANVDMTNITVSNEMFTNFLRGVDADDMIFLDPPYYVESKLYGTMGDMHDGFNHQELANVLKTKRKWLLCYNDCSYIRELYSGFTIIPMNWSYGMNRSKKSSEIVILSS